MFNGTVMSEDKPIEVVGDEFPVPAVADLIKVTIR